MTIEVRMPQMGESLAEGTLVKWHKKVGDRVRRDEPLFEISTDKVDTEVPSSADGYVIKVLVKEGETVPVHTVVCLLGDAIPAQEVTRPSQEARSPPEGAAAHLPAGRALQPAEGHSRAQSSSSRETRLPEKYSPLVR